MKSILISAGHGGPDPGAVSPDGKYREADLALALRDEIAAAVRQAARLEVAEDGPDRVNWPLRDALGIASAMSGVEVEIHFNAGPPAATGVEALSRPEHQTLAQSLSKAVADATGLPLRGQAGWKDQSAGQHHRLAFCQAGGVILEVCFISNPNDMRAFAAARPQVVSNLAAAITTAARG